MLYLVSYSHQQKTAALGTGTNTLRPLPAPSGTKVVGEEGFEPPTSCSQSRRATRLRYTPNIERRSTSCGRRVYKVWALPLLRVLQDGEFFRVGGVDSITADVRIIAATHQNLEALVETGAFREDLFHRLNVIRIHVPKLAERREDIPQLLSYFLTAASQELGVETKSLSSAALDFLTQLPWPGNVRQLENTCRWLTVMAAGREVLFSDLPPELIQQPDASPREETDTWHAQLADWANRQLAEGQSNVLRQALPLFESIMIDAALEHTGGRKAEAAELLGWGRNTLTRKLKELDRPVK